MTKRILSAIFACVLLLPFAAMVGCDGEEQNIVIEQPAEAAQAMEDYGAQMEADDAARTD